MEETKTFDADEFLFDLYAMSREKANSLLVKEIKKKKPIFEKIEVIIESGLVDVNVKSNWGRTPLHFACEYNRIEIVKLLLDKGADVNAENERYETPLHYASANNDIEIAKLLIERGADMRAENENGEVPLHYADTDEMYDIIKNYKKRLAKKKNIV